MAPKRASKRKAPAKSSRPVNAAPATSDDDAAPPAPKKTKATNEELFTKDVKPPSRDAQVAHVRDLAIPIDEGCTLTSSHRVYIDNDGVIFDASLNQTNVGGNNNKFYRIQILESRLGGDFQTWTRWGRIGDRGQSKLLPAHSFREAFQDFSKKFKDKTGNTWDDRHAAPKKGKYVFIERSYEPDTSSDDEELRGAGSRRGSKHSNADDHGPVSNLELPVQQLMELIFNAQYFKEVMADMNYDRDKLPLGKLSKRTIQNGYEQLKALAALILNTNLTPAEAAANNEAKTDISNTYYSFIPHNFGRNRPIPIITEEQLKKEIDLLDSLSDMKIAEDIMKEAKNQHDDVEEIHRLDAQFAGLGMSEVKPLSQQSNEFQELEAYLQGTKGRTHSLQYKVQDIFRIERSGEFDRFEQSDFGKLAANRRLLWHGSRVTNFGGILSQGLRIAPPEAPVSGYMFSKGLYLADMSSKSANYCYHGSSGNIGLLLLCEAELGDPMLELTKADYNADERARKAGCLSTWGKGMTGPQKWKDAGVVHPNLEGVQMPDVSVAPSDTNVPGAYLQYNEYIAYDVQQVRMRYLFRVEMGYGRNF